MASLQSSHLLFVSSSRTRAAQSVPKLPKFRVSVPKVPQNVIGEPGFGSNGLMTQPRLIEPESDVEKQSRSSVSVERLKLYAILEEVVDRIEMHKNIGEQRDNWNTLLLNSINFITLTAAMMAGIAAIDSGNAIFGLKLSSTILLSSATVMITIMNKIQPSQLVEEQRNATRLFTQLESRIENALILNEIRENDVQDAMRRVLAIDRAYPLPLIGTMLEKFPKEFKPANWWPNAKVKRTIQNAEDTIYTNGWSEELESEMRSLAEIVKMKDAEEYKKLGNLALKLNRALAFLGPVLTGISAASSVFIGSSSLSTVLAVACASLAAVVNALEHGGQIGMVFEMYRNSAGFFSLLEESIESTIGEIDRDKRENGQVFEIKMAAKLGRSLSELRDLARNSSSSPADGNPVDNFASKLF